MMQAEAETLAQALAATCMDYDQTGNLIRVRDARAMGVLRQAFAAMLRAGGQPVVIPITAEAASGFPRGDRVPDAMAGVVQSWLAVGINASENATYSMRRLGVAGCSAEEARDLAEVKMLEALARETNRAGFPAGAR